MDLRTKKSKQLIKSTFLKLRKTLPLEKIKVRELCRIAEINKSTFYRYYIDIYDLSSQLEDELVQQVLADFKGKDMLFDDPVKFFASLPMVRNDELLILFRGEPNKMFMKMEDQLLDYYANYLDTDEQKIRLTFMISGSMRVIQRFFADPNVGNEQVVQELSVILEDFQGK